MRSHLIQAVLAIGVSCVIISSGFTSAYADDAAQDDPNVVPFAKADSFTVGTDQTSTLDVLANDAGADLSIVSIETEPIRGTAEIVDGTIVYTSSHGFTGYDFLQYQIQGTDGSNLETSVGDVWISIDGDLVVRDSLGFYVGLDQWIVKNIDGLPPFTVSNLSQPAHGTAVLLNQLESVTFMPDEGFTVTYTPADGYSGLDTFTYQVKDASGQTATGTEVMFVNCDFPQQGAFTVTSGTATTLDVLASAGDPSVFTDLTLYGVESTPEHGTAVVEGDKVVYTPNDGYVGSDSFLYSLIYRGNSFSGQVTVDVVAPPFPTGGTVIQPADSLGLFAIGCAVMIGGLVVLCYARRRHHLSV